MSTISASTTTTTAYSVTADTTGTLVLQTGATPTTAVTVGTDQSVTFAQAANLPNTFGFKNRIINGAMVIDQRNAGASITALNLGYTLDRWTTILSQASKFTLQQNQGSVTPPSGFSNYLGITVGASANVTVGASDYFGVRHFVEGFNFFDCDFGKATAKIVTVSFWVRSSVTGTYYGSLLNNTVNRAYPFSYSISSANTWEQKTVTIAGDTTGTWEGATNATGVQVCFSLGFGSNFYGTANAWNATGAYSVSGETRLITTNSATFYITGVQLEKGSTATSFDYRPYGTEFALCQRYYRTSFPYGTAPAQNAGQQGAVAIQSVSTSANTISVYLPVSPTLRAGPNTITYYNTNSANALWRNTSASADGSAVGQINGSPTGWTIFMNGSPSAIGNTYQIQYSADAEL